MKNRIFIISALYLIFTINIVVAQSRKFVHPGATNGKTELDFVKAKIQAHEQPWTVKFDEMKRKHARPYIRTSTQVPQDLGKENENDQKQDATECYANALAWYYTDEDQYAEEARKAINNWAANFKGYAVPPPNKFSQGQLDCAWIGSLFGPAAELLRAYSGWTADEQKATVNMFKTKFYPALNQICKFNGNIDLTQIEAMLSIAIFCDDEVEFEMGLQRLRLRNKAYFYLSTDSADVRNYGGSNDAHWYEPLQWVDGLTQETCRDFGHHTQYAIAASIHAAEIAWNQGVDIYGEDEKRYIAMMEFTAQELLKGEQRFLTTCAQDERGNLKGKPGDVHATFEMGYNHYHGRKGRKLKFTKSLLNDDEGVRLEGRSDWNVFYETLTHNLDE